MSQGTVIRGRYPEIGAGGYTRVSGGMEFYARINALIGPDKTVLDLGAGRGVQLMRTDLPIFTRLATLKGRVARIVGADVDKAVLDNPFLDEAVVIDANKPLPLENQAFDLIYADWVLEHVARPGVFAVEVNRLLKDGGWFCARTPNRWGMTGIGTNLIPNRLHTRLLRKLQPNREVEDIFPTVYRMNTMRRIRSLFPRQAWENYSYYYNSEAPYVQESRILFNAAETILKIAPSYLGTNLHVFLKKKPGARIA